METIKRYIQFAIDNWYETQMSLAKIMQEDNYNQWYIILLITSKEFIEAVARGVYMWEWTVRVKIDNVFNKIIDDITINQAISIRDNKLEEFINNMDI